MPYTSLLSDYLGGGLDAAKPSAATLGPDIPAGSCGYYFSTDIGPDGTLYALYGGTTVWKAVNMAATLDTDGTLAANSDLKVPSQKAVKTYVDASVTGLLDLKGGTDCSANPNYPAALKGDTYIVTVAGKIGGASGTTVGAGDVYFASADNAGGTQAAVGSSWDVVIHSAAGGGAITVKDEGSTLTSLLTSLDFVGAGVTATNSGGAVTITIAGGGGGGGAYAVIQQIVCAGLQSTVSFTGIPGTYKDLRVTGLVRGTHATNWYDGLQMRLNNDATNQYTYSVDGYDNSAQYGTSNAVGTIAFDAGITGGAAPYGLMSSFDVDIPAYSQTLTNKAGFVRWNMFGDTTAPKARHYTGSWSYKQAAAISRIDFIAPSSPFMNDSVFTLYGIG